MEEGVRGGIERSMEEGGKNIVNMPEYGVLIVGRRFEVKDGGVVKVEKVFVPEEEVR